MIQFSGSATDAQDGTIPATGLSWLLRIQHCPSNCHSHDIQTFSGVASGSFTAPDHDYPSYLELILTATDSNGASASVTRRIDPKTVNLSFATVPSGLSLTVDGSHRRRRSLVRSSRDRPTRSPRPRRRRSRPGPTPSSRGPDGGAATHTVTANASGTFTATYAPDGNPIRTVVPSADAEIRPNKQTKNFGTTTTLGVKSGQYRSYLVRRSSLAGTVQAAKLAYSSSTPRHEWRSGVFGWERVDGDGHHRSNAPPDQRGPWPHQGGGHWDLGGVRRQTGDRDLDDGQLRDQRRRPATWWTTRAARAATCRNL